MAGVLLGLITSCAVFYWVSIGGAIYGIVYGIEQLL